jgi:pSer/pThr/pTyr-binding forkhead associated (FHA) protein
MPYLQIEDQRIPLLEGETRVGRGESADVPLPAASGVEDVWAIVSIGADKSATIRKASQAARVEVNGIPLAMHVSPVFHGDRVQIGETLLVFGDERHAGHTRRMAAIEADDAPRPALPRSDPRARLNGRVVSLVDGREYTVRPDGLTIGREPGCDIVIAAGEVSRRHARIELRSDGYVLFDLSTNGVLVNDLRVSRTHALARGDRIRIGAEEMRFYADLEVVEVPPPPVIRQPPPIEASAAPAAAVPGNGVAVAVAPVPAADAGTVARPRPAATHGARPTPPPELRPADTPWVLLTAVAVLAGALLYLFLRTA